MNITQLQAQNILLHSGWHSIKWFGLPEYNKSVLATRGDGTIINIVQCYFNNEKLCWQEGGISSNILDEYYEFDFWKELPNSPYEYIK